MKCIESCGYQTKPDNINTLKAHLEDCLANGACKGLKKEPTIVWRDGEFAVVEKVGKKEQVFAVSLIKKKPVELTPDKIKTAREVAKAKMKGPNVTMGSISDSDPDPGKRRSSKKASQIRKEQEENEI